MAILSQSEMFPFVLSLVEDLPEFTRRQVKLLVCDRLQLSEEEQDETTDTGIRIYESRAGWAVSALSMAGYIEQIARSTYRITDRGREVLSLNLSTKEFSALMRREQQKEMGDKEDADIITETQKMINKELLREALAEYKISFPSERWPEERYKWEAIKAFQDNWDINASDFSSMLEASLSKADILLLSANNFPGGMIKLFAKSAPEEVRTMFKELYDETKDVYGRVSGFKNHAQRLLELYGGEAKNHFQRENAISVYLWLRYPDRYYIYKFGELQKIAAKLESELRFKKGAYEENLRNALVVFNEIREEVVKDEELISIFKEQLDENCYPDPEYMTLTQDVGFYISRYFREDDSEENVQEWWPSPEEYPVNLTKDDWKRFIEEVEHQYDGCMRVLKCYLDIGGIASPTKMSETYKGHSMVYTGSISNTSRRALKYFGMSPCYDPKDDSEWLFPISFQGKRGSGNDEGRFVYKMRPELMEALRELNLDDIELEYQKEADNMNNPTFDKNTILYGPPGTGKTYNTVIYAVAIVEKKDVDVVKSEAAMDYAAVKRRFDEYKSAGRIAFTTFHQSYGYEEFIEGIRPRVSDDESESDLDYSIEPGVFKAFCERASVPVEDDLDFGFNKAPVVWKVSLAGTHDNQVREECLRNNHIRIGWDGYGPEITDDMKYEHGGKGILNAFINKMKVGDIVFSCYTSTTIDAIGVVAGDYEWDDSYDEYKRVRKVNWIVKDIREDIVELNAGASMTLSTVYQLKVTFGDALGLIKRLLGDDVGLVANDDNYVFIIDEINRGNISKIFGELITLIEDTKRIGALEEMTVTLPYSPNKPFGVPNNVYIIGTMNTADRSIALMDTALRRRFRFIEMMPDVEVLRRLELDVVGIDIPRMLETINERIEFLYDREHTIGHAFFMGLKDSPNIGTLANIFKKSVIPLLQEYFYEDYQKIQLVLGDNAKTSEEFKFIQDIDVKPTDVFKGNIVDEIDLPEKKYVINRIAFEEMPSYRQIYEKE